MGDSRRTVGSEAEGLAARVLEGRGCRIVEKGYRSRLGEVDLIAWDAGVLVFCEVKARRSGLCGPPEEAVTGAKQTRIRKLAQEYRQRHHLFDSPVRFDVIAVSLDHWGTSRVRYIPEAF